MKLFKSAICQRCWKTSWNNFLTCSALSSQGRRIILLYINVTSRRQGWTCRSNEAFSQRELMCEDQSHFTLPDKRPHSNYSVVLQGERETDWRRDKWYRGSFLKSAHDQFTGEAVKVLFLDLHKMHPDTRVPFPVRKTVDSMSWQAGICVANYSVHSSNHLLFVFIACKTY